MTTEEAVSALCDSLSEAEWNALRTAYTTQTEQLCTPDGMDDTFSSEYIALGELLGVRFYAAVILGLREDDGGNAQGDNQ